MRGTVPILVRSFAGLGLLSGEKRDHPVPSSDYFRRQADLCVRLSLIASDNQVASILVGMARDYEDRAAALECFESSLPEVSAPTLSHHEAGAPQRPVCQQQQIQPETTKAKRGGE
jgi:hypothetical protein